MTSPLRIAAVTALIAPVFAHSAAAQTAEDLRDAFSGEWFVFDETFGLDNRPCRLLLEDISVSDDGADPLKASSADCAGPLGENMNWRVDEGRIVLSTPTGELIAALGGNPQRLSGDYVGASNALVLERESGSGAKVALTEALRVHGCYYLGYTADCVEPQATQAPEFEEGTAKIDVLVKLNVRNQPRRDASIIGTVPRESTVTVNACLTTSDGIWCRAGFGETVGWLAKTALRQGEWPVISYVNAGSADGS